MDSQPVNVDSQPVNMVSQFVNLESQPVKSQPMNMDSQPVNMESQPVNMDSQSVNSTTQSMNSTTDGMVTPAQTPPIVPNNSTDVSLSIPSNDEKTETKQKHHQDVKMLERFQACMVLSGVGDAMGYYSGTWEFRRHGEAIHSEMYKMTNNEGIKGLKISPSQHFIVSDDTIMHIATANGLLRGDSWRNKLEAIAEEYVRCSDQMTGRAPGIGTLNSIGKLQRGIKWDKIPFSTSGGGCGAAMRSMCIGLLYNRENQIWDLIRISVESGRITHHHPTGYLGSFAGALFTSFAIQNVPLVQWGEKMMSLLPKVKEYVKGCMDRQPDENMHHFSYFSKQWERYLHERKIDKGLGPPCFPKKYGVRERDKFYTDISYSGCGGASGHDAPMIAYDALLGAFQQYELVDRKDKELMLWEELCLRGVLHGGDNDSTGVMACAWYGAMKGFEGVPKQNHEEVEFREVLMKLGNDLYQMHSKL